MRNSDFPQSDYYIIKMIGLGLIKILLIFLSISNLLFLFAYILLSHPHTLTEFELEDPTYMNLLLQNDTRIVRYIQQHHLTPPNNGPINFKDPGNKSLIYKSIIKILKEKRNGIFIEIGASDGTFLSNTLEFELTHNWTGLLIEADPILIRDLIKYQRNVWIADLCVSNVNWPVQISIKRYEDLSLVQDEPAEDSEETEVLIPRETSSFKAQCFPLFSILSALNLAKRVDYLSFLNLEEGPVGVGSVGVLRTIPWEAVLIKTISIKLNREKPILKDFLLSKGFKIVQFFNHSDWEDLIFAHSSVL